MSLQLHSALAQIIKMPYFRNEASRSAKTKHGHEDAIAKVLEDNGFTSNVEKLPKFKKEFLNEWEKINFQPVDFLEEKTDKEYKLKSMKWQTKRFKHMKPGTYIQQPCGTHSFPDFLIRDFDGRFIVLEAKSGKKQDGKAQNDEATTGAPMWNDNLPKHGAIYVYSNEKNNKTTVALGQDVIDKEVIKLRDDYDAEQKLLDQKYKKLVDEADKKNRGWRTKVRPQNFQGGGMEKSDWFKHADRQPCEDNVLKFALAQ